MERHARLTIQEARALPSVLACVRVRSRMQATQDTYVPTALHTHLHVLSRPSESACALRALPPRQYGATKTPPCAPLSSRKSPFNDTNPTKLSSSHFPFFFWFCPSVHRATCLYIVSLSGVSHLQYSTEVQHRFVYKLVESFLRREKEKDAVMRREEGRRNSPRSREEGNGDRMHRRMQWYKPTAIFPRILSPQVQSTPICLAASSTN